MKCDHALQQYGCAKLRICLFGHVWSILVLIHWLQVKAVSGLLKKKRSYKIVLRKGVLSETVYRYSALQIMTHSILYLPAQEGRGCNLVVKVETSL